jgi:hypothetical protein
MTYIVDKIRESDVGHAIAYHSFSHINLCEITRQEAEVEIEDGAKLAEEIGVTFRSFVFPNDRIAHVDVLREHGCISYRGSLPRQNRVAASLISQPVQPIWVDGIWEIPCSIVFSHSLARLCPGTLLFRARTGMERAVKLRSIFHTHLHPQDLLSNRFLGEAFDRLLKSLAIRRQCGKMQTTTMGKLASSLTKALTSA